MPDEAKATLEVVEFNAEKPAMELLGEICATFSLEKNRDELRGQKFGDALIFIADRWIQQFKEIQKTEKDWLANVASHAYAAYRRHTGGKSLATGAPIPEWGDLPENIREAWGASTKSITDIFC